MPGDDPLFDAFAVKICGVRDAATAEVALRAGASAVGVVLAPSRRQVTAEMAALIATSLERLGGRQPLVGLVVNESSAALAGIVERSGIDAVQLAGDETAAILDGLTMPAIKSIRLRHGQSVEDGRRAIEPWLAHRNPVRMILVDAHVDGQYGGTGHLADWSLAAALAERYPIMLAGGLTPANVVQAIQEVRPAAVDVSSGVETDGVKDQARIEAFIAAALSTKDRDPGS